MQYPDLLTPQSTQRIALPSGREVQVATATPHFRRWTGEVPKDTYNGKPLLEFNGERVFAELAILRIFEHAGWQGRWVDGFGNKTKYRIGYWGENATKDLPAEQRTILDSIRAKTNRAGGCFDVYCWRDGIVLFVESKRKAHDVFQLTQLLWLEAALDMGTAVESFLIVEWSFYDSLTDKTVNNGNRAR